MVKQATAAFRTIANAACVTIVLSLLVVGCSNRSNEIESRTDAGTEFGNSPLLRVQPAAIRNSSPRQFLANVFSRYRGAPVYHDEGVVRLSYRSTKGHEHKVAPLRIWLDHGRCYVVAYDVRLRSDNRGLIAWIRDESTTDFDSQVLLRSPASSSQQLTAASLLPDPILVERISAGLAGPPPQVEWLFSDQPMKHLFHPGHQFAFDSPDETEGHQCHRIQVDTGSDRYRFWIDQTSGVVRRIDLPPIIASPAPGETTQTMTLSVNLYKATFRESGDPPEFDSLPSNPQYVKRFVPLPPIRPAEVLGTRPPAFQIRSRDGRITVSEHGSDREATIIIRCSGDAGSRISAELLQRWSEAMPPNFRRRVRLLVVLDEGASTHITDGLRLPIAHDRDANAATLLGLDPRALAILDRSGRLVWKQSDVSSTGLVTLGAILADVLDGVDVPKRVREQWDEQNAAYRSAIGGVRTVPNGHGRD